MIVGENHPKTSNVSDTSARLVICNRGQLSDCEAKVVLSGIPLNF